MRDVRESIRIVQQLVKSPQDSHWTVGASREIRSFKSQRSDSMPTTPVNGAYFTPTTYEAFFSSLETPPSGIGEFTDLGVPKLVKTGDTGWNNGFYYNYGCAGTRPDIPSPIVSRARSAIRSKLQDNDLNIGTSLGEARESFGTIVSVLRGVYQLRKAVRGGPVALYKYAKTTVAEAGGLPKAVASAYLGFMYGVKPLMQDAYAAASIIQNGLSKPAASAKVVIMDDDYKVPANRSDGVAKYSGEVSRGIEIGVTFKVTNPSHYELWRYGLTNPAAIAWELTTLSFVIDWFTGIGAFIEGLQQPVGLSILSQYETSFVRNNFREELRLTPAPNQWGIVMKKECWATGNYNLKAMYRTAGSSLPPPAPYVSLGLSSTQATSLLALITARA